MPVIRRIASLLGRLRRDTSGVAVIEYAFTAPIFLTLFLSGAEVTNFTLAKLRVSQLALHVADNGSRIGSDSILALKQISEAQINDLLIGAGLQAGTLDLKGRGRVILYSLEPMASPNQSKFYVHWRRCFGDRAYDGSYPQGKDHLTAIGPPGKEVEAVPPGGGVMYVEVEYEYQPLISGRLVPTRVMRDTAAMVVRDERDFNGGVNKSGIYNSENATASTC